LDTAQIVQVFRKGTDPRIDSYSAFFDNGHRKATGLADYLKARAVTEIASPVWRWIIASSSPCSMRVSLALTRTLLSMGVVESRSSRAIWRKRSMK
jgi:hypothetical protein